MCDICRMNAFHVSLLYFQNVNREPIDFIRDNDIQKIIAIDTCDGTESKYYILVQGSLISVSYGFYQSHLNLKIHNLNS